MTSHARSSTRKTHAAMVADEDADGGLDDAPAELLEVLPDRHATSRSGVAGVSGPAAGGGSRGGGHAASPRV